jgi:protein tyrosine/serine phosphatase
VSVLAWHGCVNVRDVGGLPTSDGGTIADRALVRSDSVSQLRRGGWEALVEYGVRTIVDLRYDEEREDDPPRELDVEVVHVPLFGDRDADLGDELQRRIDAEPNLAEQYALFYGDWLERYPQGFASAIRAIAGAGPGGVLVHCLGGKDRTGVVVALALDVVGVPREAIGADYALTADALGQPGSAPPEAMEAVLRDVDGACGSSREYLRAGGASDAELDRLVERLVA